MRSNTIQHQCENHNASFRQITNVNSYSPNTFLSSLSGNLLITGGDALKRRELLMKAILQQRRTSCTPIIIFSESIRLQNELISAAKRGDVGELFVISEDYCNYDFFSGMKSKQIADYFSDISAIRHYRDSGELYDYIGSFLNILGSRADVKLASIRSFARNTDTDIAGAAGAGSEDADLITASARGGVNFRRLLNSTCQVFDSLTSAGCDTDFNIISAANKDCVVFINTDAVDFDFLGVYFLQELKTVIKKEFTVIFDDATLLNCKELLEFLEIIKQRSNINVVVSYGNVLSLPDTSDRLEHFKKKIILLDGDIPATDMQKLLNVFGDYPKMVQTTAESNTPHILYSLHRTQSLNATTVNSPKVVLEELGGNKAVISGHNGAEILVVRNLI